jgi:hypothetical protein
MDGACGARQIVDFVDFHIQGEGYIMTQDFEAFVIAQMLDVSLGTRKIVIDADDVVTLIEQTVDQMGTKKACASGHQDAFVAVVEPRQNQFLFWV